METGKSPNVMLYGLKVLVNTLGSYTLLVIISLALNMPYILILAITYSSLRIISGGAHASTSLRCIVLGTIIFIVLGFVTRLLFLEPGLSLSIHYFLIVFLIGCIIVYLYAPHKYSGRTYTEKKILKLRILSFLYLAVWLAIAIWLSGTENEMAHLIVTASAVGLTWQLVTLTPAGSKLFLALEGLLFQGGVSK